MSWIILDTAPTFSMMFVGYFALVATVGRCVFREPRRQAWIVSAFATTMISVLGSTELIAWTLTPARTFTDTAMSYMLLEFLKAYLLVDLLHSSWWHPAELGLLDGWIHHVVYIVVMEKILHSHQIHNTRPFWVVEIPAAIRAWQAMGALSQQVADRWFGATFVAFRIVWPTYAVTQILAQDWLFAFIGITIIAHMWWFAVWMKRRH